MTKMAAVQMCSSHSVDENLKVAGQLIAEAAGKNAKLIVLPEMFAIMGLHEKDKIACKETWGCGKIQSFLSEQAQQHQVWIVGGTIPIACHNQNKVAASSLVFDEGGHCVARYDKMHLFDVTLSDGETYRESNTIESGKEVVVVETPFGKLGLAVCYDVRFPELFRSLLNKGAEIIVLPSAFTVPTGEAHWELLVRSRAVENFCYVIGACQGGAHTNGRKTYGHSLIVAPWGNIVAEIPSAEPGIVAADIDLQKLYQCRQAIPIVAHQKIMYQDKK